MNILGIDYGLKNIGLSIASNSPLVEPLNTIKVKSSNQLIDTIVRLIDEYEIDKIVIGLPEGKIEPKVKLFQKQLNQITDIPIVLWDETYSSKQAIIQARQSGKSIGKIKQKEHSLAAAVILQSYLDQLE